MNKRILEVSRAKKDENTKVFQFGNDILILDDSPDHTFPLLRIRVIPIYDGGLGRKITIQIHEEEINKFKELSSFVKSFYEENTNG